MIVLKTKTSTIQPIHLNESDQAKLTLQGENLDDSIQLNDVLMRRSSSIRFVIIADDDEPDPQVKIKDGLRYLKTRLGIFREDEELDIPDPTQIADTENDDWTELIRDAIFNFNERHFTVIDIIEAVQTKLGASSEVAEAITDVLQDLIDDSFIIEIGFASNGVWHLYELAKKPPIKDQIVHCTQIGKSQKVWAIRVVQLYSGQEHYDWGIEVIDGQDFAITTSKMIPQWIVELDAETPTRRIAIDSWRRYIENQSYLIIEEAYPELLVLFPSLTRHDGEFIINSTENPLERVKRERIKRIYRQPFHAKLKDFNIDLPERWAATYLLAIEDCLIGLDDHRPCNVEDLFRYFQSSPLPKIELGILRSILNYGVAAGLLLELGEIFFINEKKELAKGLQAGYATKPKLDVFIKADIINQIRDGEYAHLIHPNWLSGFMQALMSSGDS